MWNGKDEIIRETDNKQILQSNSKTKSRFVKFGSWARAGGGLAGGQQAILDFFFFQIRFFFYPYYCYFTSHRHAV